MVTDAAPPVQPDEKERPGSSSPAAHWRKGGQGSVPVRKFSVPVVVGTVYTVVSEPTKMGEAAPEGQYRSGPPHGATVGDVEPAGQKYPAWQGIRER